MFTKLKIFRSCFRLPSTTKRQIVYKFSSQRPPQPAQHQNPNEELDPLQVQFINRLIKGEFAGLTLSEEMEKQQKLSFDLVLIDKPQLILNKLQKHKNPTANELFLYLFAYSNLSKLTDPEIKPYFLSLLQMQSQLSPHHILKLYQILYSLKQDSIELPPFPTLSDVPPNDLIELGYFLSKLYPFQEDRLKELCNSIGEELISQNPLLYASFLQQLPQNIRTSVQKSKTSNWIDKVERTEEMVKIIIMKLRKGDVSVASHIDSLNLQKIELSMILDLAIQSTLNNIQPLKILKHLSFLDLQNVELTPQNYISLWILLTKTKSLTSNTLYNLRDSVAKISPPANLNVDDIFTVMMSAMVLERRQFLSRNESLIFGKIGDLKGNEVYALWRGAVKNNLKELQQEIKKDVLNRNDILKQKKKEILG